jgi:hypothetical protein
MLDEEGCALRHLKSWTKTSIPDILASLASLVFEISYSENGFTGIFYKNENEKKSSVQTTKLKYPSYFSDFGRTRFIFIVPSHHSRRYFCDISISTPVG